MTRLVGGREGGREGERQRGREREGQLMYGILGHIKIIQAYIYGNRRPHYDTSIIKSNICTNNITSEARL